MFSLDLRDYKSNTIGIQRAYGGNHGFKASND